MNKQEAIDALFKVLSKVKFSSGIINPETGKDTGDESAWQFQQTMKTIIFGKTGGVIYKMKEAAEFYKEFVAATSDPKVINDPNQCALYFLAAIRNAQNSALRTAKSAVPENFWPILDDLMEVNSRKV